MKKIKLAVLSDIHAGTGARARDLCPPDRNATKIDDNYQDKFIRFLDKEALKADFLVLPGDVTHTAQPDEVELASSFVTRVANQLGVPVSRTIFVPGNHDVDWSVLKLPDTTGLRKTQRYDPLRHVKFQFKAILDNSTGSVLEDPHFGVWQYDELIAVGYNSSFHDDPLKSEHHGLIDTSHLELLRSYLSTLDLSGGEVRLFLVHHHPLQYSDPTPEDPDFSIMVNSDNLLDLLREFKFDLLIHGHRHLPRFKTHSVEGATPLAVLCSGSFSVELDTRWLGAINNQFHLITIEGRDPEEEMILGRVTSWTYYYNRGWVPSKKEHDGIQHIEPFGAYMLPKRLLSLIAPILTQRFAETDYIEWRWVIEQLPQLEHLRPEVVIRTLDELQKVLGFRRLREEPEEIILLKEVP
jgi:UDP-2,3-diacylglucosamine pyrophosphatase LpxH